MLELKEVKEKDLIPQSFENQLEKSLSLYQRFLVSELIDIGEWRLLWLLELCGQI